jgi:hypothetical protein
MLRLRSLMMREVNRPPGTVYEKGGHAWSRERNLPHCCIKKMAQGIENLMDAEQVAD